MGTPQKVIPILARATGHQTPCSSELPSLGSREAAWGLHLPPRKDKTFSGHHSSHSGIQCGLGERPGEEGEEEGAAARPGHGVPMANWKLEVSGKAEAELVQSPGYLTLDPSVSLGGYEESDGPRSLDHRSSWAPGLM